MYIVLFILLGNSPETVSRQKLIPCPGSDINGRFYQDIASLYDGDAGYDQQNQVPR